MDAKELEQVARELFHGSTCWQADVARLLGVYETTVRRWEKADPKNKRNNGKVRGSIPRPCEIALLAIAELKRRALDS
jgi:DNA-binding XRE family transcriptional regulator